MSDIDDMNNVLSRLDERTERMAKDLDKVKHVLIEGNGKPAVVVQVATMHERLSSVEDHIKENKIPRHVSFGVVVSIIIAIFSTLVGFMKS